MSVAGDHLRPKSASHPGGIRSLEAPPPETVTTAASSTGHVDTAASFADVSRALPELLRQRLPTAEVGGGKAVSCIVSNGVANHSESNTVPDICTLLDGKQPGI